MKTRINELKKGDLVAWAEDNGRGVSVYRTRVYRIVSPELVSVYRPGRSSGKGMAARFITQEVMDLAQEIIVKKAQGKAVA